jgi:hypothetical protein
MSTIPETIVAHHCGIKVNHMLSVCAELVFAERHFLKTQYHEIYTLVFIAFYSHILVFEHSICNFKFCSNCRLKIVINNIVDLPVCH